MDAIATDHAPHSILEKEVEFSAAANGIIGLETSLPLSLALIRDGILSPTQLIDLMSTQPAKLLGVSGGSLHQGAIADITVIDPDKVFSYDRETIVSKSSNSPFIDWELQGKAVLTMLGGRITHDEMS